MEGKSLSMIQEKLPVVHSLVFATSPLGVSLAGSFHVAVPPCAQFALQTTAELYKVEG